MTLLSTIQLAKNALFTSQLGIQVASNNIANVDTPGYVRENLVLGTAPPQRRGTLVTGNGVQSLGVVRQVDAFLQERLRAATSDLANGETQEKIYVELEAVIGELSKSDLSTSLGEFFNSIHDVLNQPEDAAVRNLAVQRGQGLAGDIQHMDSRVRQLRVMANERLVDDASEINRLVKEIAKLNVQIVETEQGGNIVSDAVGLRDKRDLALEDLAKLVNIQVDEQKTGAVNVFVGGDYLVFDGTVQLVETVTAEDRGLAAVELRLSRSDARLPASSGEVAGLLAARDDILGGYLDQLDALTETIIFEFNKVHASGQGLTGFRQITGDYAADDTTAALDDAGLTFTPNHGSFQVEIVNRDTGIRKTSDVFVQLNGLDNDTTLESLAIDLNAIDGLSAQITTLGQLSLSSDSPDLEFAFANDSSGVLAALGLNTFFTGTSASSVDVTGTLKADPGKLAISRGGIGSDTRNGELLADLPNTPLDSRDGATLVDVYEQWMGETGQASALARSVAEGYRAFQSTLEGEHLGLSGVNLDEEAVNMISFQRSFQASAKVISTISELLDVLVNL